MSEVLQIQRRDTEEEFIDQWEEYSRGMQYYYRRKFHLMRRIIQDNLPVIMKEDEEPFCQVCKKRFSEVREMHIEHPNNNGEAKRVNGESPGGTQCLKRYEEHFEEGRTLWVACSECHYLLHKRKDDGHASRLRRGRPWLDHMQDFDAEFHIRQRLKEGQIYESGE